MNKRDFLKNAATISSLALLPTKTWAFSADKRLRTAHIGLGGMGQSDLASITSHTSVEVVGLCDVDSDVLEKVAARFPNAKSYKDYRVMLKELGAEIDAVVVSTPDHTHAPASIMAMEMNKPVYCQKPLTHYVEEARAMDKMAKGKGLVTQMGIQVHSFYDYKLATLLIQDGIIGKVHTVRAWSPKNWGYNGPAPTTGDPVPDNLDWDLWLGTSAKRPYKEGFYHPGNWRKLVDYGCATLGDMGVHIFDTPYNALQLDVPRTITTNCRKPNGFGYPEKNMVTYEFPGTKYTADTLKWVWYDGAGADKQREDLMLPEGADLHDQGAMFIGEKGRLYLPHFRVMPKLIVDGSYKDIDITRFKSSLSANENVPEGQRHYHEFVDACLGKGQTSAPFSYASRLTETILLGVIAGRFPNQTLHWDAKKAQFKEEEANQYLSGVYREF